MLELLAFFSSEKRKQKKADYDAAVAKLKGDPQVQEAHETVVRYQNARRRKMNVLGYILATVAAGFITEVGKQYVFPASTPAPAEPKMVTLEYESKQWQIPAPARARVEQFMDTSIEHKLPPSDIEQKLLDADKADGKQDYVIHQEGIDKLK